MQEWVEVQDYLDLVAFFNDTAISIQASKKNFAGPLREAIHIQPMQLMPHSFCQQQTSPLQRLLPCLQKMQKNRLCGHALQMGRDFCRGQAVNVWNVWVWAVATCLEAAVTA